MMAMAQRSAHPFAPLVLDDAGSLEAMAAAVMRLHSTLMTVGRCYKTDATRRIRACGCILYDIRPIAGRSLRRHL